MERCADWYRIHGPMTPTPDKPAGEALKACPFCGREQAIISPYLDTDQTAWACVCRVCGARMDAMSKAKAAAAWNTRTPPPSALDDEVVARLDAACTWAKYEYPLLAAPDGMVAVPFADLRDLLTRLKDSSK